MVEACVFGTELLVSLFSLTVFPGQVVQGDLLGAAPPLERLISVIKHEGTEEHA